MLKWQCCKCGKTIIDGDEIKSKKGKTTIYEMVCKGGKCEDKEEAL